MWSRKSGVSRSEVARATDAALSGAADAHATIGEGLCISGDIHGNHDLSVDGQVAGSIFLPADHVLVGPDARVEADIAARIIEVEGWVKGNLKAAERIIISGMATVEGDIEAPQIGLEEGCRFKGSVQMREPDMSRRPAVEPRLVDDPGMVRMKAAAAGA